jgi:DNA-binding transcriptional ArsR family regulator
MKRDMELIRKILFHLEDRPLLKAETELLIEGYERSVIMYHMLLLAQAGLVDFEPEKTKTGRIIRAHVLGLNWAGHEFLDAVRTEKVWRKLLKYAKEKGGSLPFELLKVLGTELLKESLKS